MIDKNKPVEKQIDEIYKDKERKLPINNLDSAWLSAEPDYLELQRKFNSQVYSQVFDFFNSSIRLGNIPKEKARVLEYDLVSCSYAFKLGYKELALSILMDVASVVEVSHGVKGFRTQAMNKIIQEINQTTEEKKRSIMGGKSNE